MHDDLEFSEEYNGSVHWLVSDMTPKRGTHATIPSNGLQNELVIGRVGVLGNLGKEKSTMKLGSTSKVNLLSGTR